MTVPLMPTRTTKPLRGATLCGVRGAATLVAGVVACALGVTGSTQANDGIGWGLMTFNSRDTTTYRTSEDKAVLQLSCGGGHTLALRKDPSLASVSPCSSIGGGVCNPQEGVVVGWGYNEFGQATVGVETDEASGLVRPWSALQVAAGYGHSMRLYREVRDNPARVGGAVSCWGDNTSGQCMVPQDVARPYRHPTDPSKDRAAVQIAAGYNFSVALMNDGTLRGWGDNSSNQLEFPVWTAADAPKATLIGKPIRFYKIAAGGSHVVGLVATNQTVGDYGGMTTLPRQVRAWGASLSGQSTVPKMYISDGLGGFTEKPFVAVDISAGLSHTLALTGLGGVTGGTALYASPADPSVKLPVRAGLIIAWGDDSYGQATPPHMRASTDTNYRAWDASRRITWTALAAGGYHSAAVDTTGYVYCWGLGADGDDLYGDYGQVNDDPEKVNINSRQPQPGVQCDVASRYANTQLVSAGLYHTGAVSLQWDTKAGDGGPRPTKGINVALTWGRNYEAQCGVPYETNYTLSRKMHRQLPAVMKGTVPRSRWASDLRGIWAGGFMPNRYYGFFSDYSVGLDRLNLPVGWGDNSYLQRDFFAPTSPVTLVPSKKYKQLAAGGHMTWMLDTTGAPYFIGDPLYNFSSETDTPSGGGFVDISAGAFHTVFRHASGQVKVTGGGPSTYWDDAIGQEVQINWGQGAFLATNSADPDDRDRDLGGEDGARTMNLLVAKDISAGWFHSAALTTDGIVRCWGAGETQFMGSGPVSISNAPNFSQSVVPADLPACTEVAAGGYHTVALTKETGAGKVRVWGSNYEGQRVTSAIESVAISDNAIGVRRVDGMVRAWGDATATASGQLDVDGTRVASLFAGYGTMGYVDRTGNTVLLGSMTTVPTFEPEPGTVTPLRFASLGIGESHVVGLRTDGSVVCWGSNTYGQVRGIVKNLGPLSDPLAPRRIHDGLNSDICNAELCTGKDGGTTQSELPIDPLDVVRLNKSVMGDVSDDIDFCTAFPTSGSCNIGLTDDLLIARQVGAGRRHSVALRIDGSIQAWGGWISSSKTISDVVAATPVGGYSFFRIAAGGSHNVALRVSGTIEMWGSNANGQTQPLNVPGGLQNIIDIAAGDRHTVILKSDGKVYAWGDMVGGSQPQDSPARIPANARAVAIAAGGSTTVMLEDRFTPVVIGSLAGEPVPSLDDAPLFAVAVRAGGFHSAALLEDGTVTTWGAGQNRVGEFPDYGQSSTPPSSINPADPLRVETMSTLYPNTISAGALSTVVVRSRLPLSLTGGSPSPGPDISTMPDFDGDGCVTMTDLGVLMMEFGNMAWPGGDLDGNGEIDMGDISVLQMQLGDCVDLTDAD